MPTKFDQVPPMRYRFFREHKYLSFRLSEFEREVAKTDFSDEAAVLTLKAPLQSLWELMDGQGAYEESAIFSLLCKKDATLTQNVENDHLQHEQYFQEFTQAIENILAENSPQERVHLGYLFYLSYRFFVAEILRHLHMEEAFIMPALQKHYTDDALSLVEASTYNHMTSSQMVEMMLHLFPHMDINDKLFFLEDIKKTQPEKFVQAWEGIKSHLTKLEQKIITEKLMLECFTEP